MILLAEHDEPSLAAKKKQQHVASETATSTPKNRVWGFENTASGRPGVDPDLSTETATGSVQYSYETASGRGYYYTRDHLGSVRELTDSSGNICNSSDYDLYGRAIAPLPQAAVAMWLKADTGVTKDGSGKVSQWADQSGNGNSASQSSSGNQPTWVANGAGGGRASIHFDGSTSYLNLPTASTLGITSHDYEIYTMAYTASSNIQFLVAGDL